MWCKCLVCPGEKKEEEKRVLPKSKIGGKLLFSFKVVNY